MPDDETTVDQAERAHLRRPEGSDEPSFRGAQELRKVSRDYPFICPVDFRPHKGSPIGEDPNDDPTFLQRHSLDDGAHYLG